MGQAKYERGFLTPEQEKKVSPLGLGLPEGIAELLNPYPMNLQTGKRELTAPALFEGIASAGKAIAGAVQSPIETYKKVAPALDEMGKRMVASTTLRPGQMEMVDGELRPLTSEEVVQERIDAGMDPTVAFAGAAPIARGVATKGIGALAAEPGVLTSGGTRAVSNVTLPGHDTKNVVVDLGVRFKSEHPAFKNMSASYVEPSDPVAAVRTHNELIQDKIEFLQSAKKFMDPSRQQTFDDQIQELFDERISLYDTQEAQKEVGQIQRYVQTDNRTGTDTLGIIRVTAPQDDILRASGGKNAGPVDIGHDPLYTGGESGLTPQDISRRKAAIDAEMYSLRAAIEDNDVVSGVPKNLDLDSDEGQVFLFEKALATVKQKELKGELDYTGPKNAPIGFARFADIDLDGERYMRLTEIQSDLFKETRASKKGEPVRDYKSNVWDGGEELPELYPNMKKDDKPLSSAVLKASVATAIQRGSKGIVLPNSATSDAGVRYSDSNVKKLLNKTVKDLGEGFSYRKVEVPSTMPVKFDDIGNVRDAIKKGNQQTVTEHYVLEWSGINEVPDEMKFATGGLVSLPPRPASRGIEDVIRKYRREGWMD